MDRYDENLAENKFLSCLKLEYEDILEEAVSSNWVICVPKSDIIKEITFNTMLDHILIPVMKEDNNEEFTTKRGNELILHEGCLISKRSNDRRLNVLFEETFYEGKVGKYKVVCVDNYITNLFKEEFLPLSDTKNERLENSVILKNLRFLNDFVDYLRRINQNPLIIHRIDSYIADFLSLPFSMIEEPRTENLREKVHNIFEKSIEFLRDANHPLSENETTILHISVESYIAHNLYKVLFAVSTSDMASNDEKLNRLLHSIKDFSISNFDIKISNLNWLLSAKYELAAINNFKSPFGKLQCVRRSIECFETENIMNSDELLPVLVFCIIKCNLSNWFANLSFIKSYYFSLKLNNEYSFILSSLEAALVYIQSGEITKLTTQDLKTDAHNNCNLTSSLKLDNLNSRPLKAKNEMLTFLYEKIMENNLIGVKMILETKESPEAFLSLLGEQSQLCHPLCICTKCKRLLHESYIQFVPCNINSSDENMMTPLHIAAMHGSTSVVEYLLAKGANCNLRNLVGMTPLHFAAYKGHQNVLLLFLHSGCDINDLDNEGNTALHLACIAGHDSCVKALIFYAESVGFLLGFTLKNIYGDTPLHLASHWGYSSIVKLLMSQFHVVMDCLDIRNIQNQTPIDCAHNTAISSLLKESAIKNEIYTDNLLLINFGGQNLGNISNVVIGTNLEVNETLEEKDRIFQNEESNRILRKITKAIQVEDIKLACFYLEINDNTCPANYFNASTSNKCHPLCQCHECSNIPQVSPVKCNLSLINFVGENHGVLHIAVCAGNLEMCRILLHNGANPQVITKIEKQSCLHLAVIKENLEIMELLIMFNADVNSMDVFGNTPLHWCCIRGWKKGALLLTESGAKVHINNKEEMSPKEAADRNGHMDIVGILIRKMNES